jgi:2-oxoacid:acceptor oxidoreductase delta subunit (pyruvate/2-ketoisovalerate family)
MQMPQDRHSSKLKRSDILGPCAYIFDSANTGSWRIERPEAAFDKCIKCGVCALNCPAGVITIDKSSEKCVRIMWDYCKGCGICANECPKKAIAMVSERSAK